MFFCKCLALQEYSTSSIATTFIAQTQLWLRVTNNVSNLLNLFTVLRQIELLPKNYYFLGFVSKAINMRRIIILSKNRVSLIIGDFMDLTHQS